MDNLVATFTRWHLTIKQFIHASMEGMSSNNVMTIYILTFCVILTSVIGLRNKYIYYYLHCS